MWADYLTLFGGIKLSSDDLNLLRPERKKVVKKAFSIETCERFVPILKMVNQNGTIFQLNKKTSCS